MWLAGILIISSSWVLLSQIFDFNPLIIFSFFSFLLEIFKIDQSSLFKGILVLICFYAFAKIMDKILDKTDKK
jgi:hypothetical protein